MNYEFTMKMCHDKKEQKKMLEEFVASINEEEGKQYVNLIRDGESVDWSQPLKETAAGQAQGAATDEDDDDNAAGTENSLPAPTANDDAKVSSTSELDRQGEVTNADVEKMLESVVGVGGGVPGMNAMNRFAGSKGRDSDVITSTDQSQEESDYVNGQNSRQQQQPHNQQLQQNGDANNPVKNILQKKHQKVVPVPPPHPPPPPPPQTHDHSRGENCLVMILIG